MKTAMILTAVGLLSATLVNANGPKARPGKGLILIPGTYAEYSNASVSNGKTSNQPSTIMVVMGKKGPLDMVQVLIVKDNKAIVKRSVAYDLTKQKKPLGRVLGTGKETLTIGGKKVKCSWEKRRNGTVTATFWTSPDLPFERYAKVLMESDDGQKMVTTLVQHGPDMKEPEKATAFLKRLQKLTSTLKASDGGTK